MGTPLLAALLALSAAGPLAAQMPDKSVLTGDFERQKGILLKYVDAMPDSGMAFAPTKGVRTYTCGEAPWRSFEALLLFTDLVMMDLKHISRAKHNAATGQANERILDNARRMALTDKPLLFRTPVVPSVNDTEEEIGQIALFVRDLIDLRKTSNKGNNGPAEINYELLAFHKLGADKYPSLGLEYKAAAINPPTKERMAGVVEAAKRHGIEAWSR